MCGPCGRGTSGSGAAVPRLNTGGSVRSRCPAAMTNAGISGSAAAPRHSARSCARLPLPRKTLLPFFSRNPCLSHMAKGQGIPQGGDGFIKYLADDRTCLPAHRLLLLETFPALTASLRRGSASRSRGQSWLLPGTILPPETIQLLPHSSVPAGTGNGTGAWCGPQGLRGHRRGLESREWQEPPLSLCVSPTEQPVWLLSPSPAPWHLLCPSPGINRGDAGAGTRLCPGAAHGKMLSGAFPFGLVLLRGIANGNPDPEGAAGVSLSLCSAQGAIKKGVNYLPK